MGSNKTHTPLDDAHCNECGGERKHFVHREFVREASDGEVSWSDTAQILECCGCQTLSFRTRHYFSEWEEETTNDVTGEPEMRRGFQEQVYPPPVARKLPRWIRDLSDWTLREVVKEVYVNLQANNRISAAMGARLLIDRIMNLTVKDIGGFEKKLEAMRSGGYISENEKKHLLSPVVDAGNAASHRAYHRRQ